MIQPSPREIWDHPEVASVFRCRGCGACCRGGEAGVALSPGEAASIAHRLGLSGRGFRAVFCLRQGGRLLLRRKADRMCSLWREGCLAWEVKPRTCSLWPFPAHLLTDEAGLAAVRGSCPGIAPQATPEGLRRALRLIHQAYPKTGRRPRAGRPPSEETLSAST